ncbi:unnamed protein product (macronuclear) [Paramecium tetraurelia]|uniref:Uncharacterized protein n=1 Tax=Paramecium tetraurelia TaxID=5888 RepID=A0CHY3_PARTE|nr:uncharacterized protein GSPATT00038502001 [Paramecium tetraurelia]CAK70400.1 unnamed protein product [Paramecium tetraurelia]|eukprot:XP_001437797.1 hypothetical protein (macronuclear) [Paramecium tetraurelia strain d4-2]
MLKKCCQFEIDNLNFCLKSAIFQKTNPQINFNITNKTIYIQKQEASNRPMCQDYTKFKIQEQQLNGKIYSQNNQIRYEDFSKSRMGRVANKK